MLLAKIRRSDDSKEAIFIGLSEENLKRLKQGKPILINSGQLEIEQDIFILYGKTEEDIRKEYDFPRIN
jgi:hypothetical protein